tara:strand:- start:124 stop:291 length:168 start_codon:yes stop_codon:yes gene_type:complete
MHNDRTLKKLTNCKKCKHKFLMHKGFRVCGNLGCTEYFKKFGGKIVRKKNEEEEE